MVLSEAPPAPWLPPDGRDGSEARCHNCRLAKPGEPSDNLDSVYTGCPNQEHCKNLGYCKGIPF